MERTGTVDYSKGLIYKLCCKDPNITDIYIGSTTNMRHRKCQHKTACNNPNDKAYNLKVYQNIREFGGWDNWTMVLVEYVNATCKQELQKEERVVIELLKPTLNYVIPTRTRKEYYEVHKEKKSEYSKKYRELNRTNLLVKDKIKYEKNKEKILEQKKIYYEKNKEQIVEKKKEKQKIKVKCEFCECLITQSYLKKHQKTNICKKFQFIED